MSSEPPPLKPLKRPRRRRAWWPRLILALAAVLAIAAALLFAVGVDYAYEPDVDALVNPQRVQTDTAYDVWGRTISRAEAETLQRTEEGRVQLLASNGAVPIDEALLTLGRHAFYQETFGNEVFLTDILGALHGPLRMGKVAKAIVALRGRGTTNLRVELAEAATIGGRRFEKDEVIDTGLDVPRGAWAPLGMKVRFQRGRVRMGMTCAVCHSTVDPASKRVVEGAPNSDFAAGLMIALASNSAAYFPNAEVTSLDPFLQAGGRQVLASTGRWAPLPDPAALEEAVDTTLLRWPPGNFDSANDGRATPTQIPDSFTLGGHPYGWTGFSLVGPFNGLSVLNNNVHGLNSDKFPDREKFHRLHGIDRELYIGTLLQNAPNPRFRYDPASGRTPLEFFADVDPTPPAPVVNEVVATPTAPLASFIAPDGYWISSPGQPVWRQVNALSAFQNSLAPPLPSQATDLQKFARGHEVFARADCRRCHDGPAYTNNRVLPVAEVGTDPRRAPAFAPLEAILAPPMAIAFDTRVPTDLRGRVLDVPLTPDQDAQVRLAWAFGGSGGGYKVKGLVGLAWTAPYLHDGGVAVGPDAATQLGVPGTTLRGIAPDPANSLRALLDRELRARVLAANRAKPHLEQVAVTGAGHAFWVDPAGGFTTADQDDLIHYLLNLRYDAAAPRPESALRAQR